MASYTSTQNGNFNDAATWGGGGFPNANGDQFTITNGHTVVYNVSGSISDGFGDSNIYGHLRHSGGMVTELRMNGHLRVRTNGLYEMVDDSTLVIKGTNADDHQFSVYGEAGASFLATGSSPTQETKLSASGDAGDDFFNVDSSTNFQTGDWCSIHFRYSDLKSREDWINNTAYPTGPLSGDGVNQSRSSWENGNQNHNESSHNLDEGFIIHDINGNTIYPRNLVGPEETIVAARTDQIKVSDSRVFRVGQKLIFGTSSKRSVKEVASINNNRNVIKFTSNLTSTDVVGEKVYLGGVGSHHYGKSTVRRVASQIAATAAKDATTITINEASDYVVGDEFYVDHVKTDDETWSQLFGGQGGNHWRYDTNKRHQVTNKSGNTLTFTPALPHAAAAGTFLYKANRKITIRGADYSVDKPSIYFRSRTTQASIDGQNRFDRKLLIKDVQFLGMGNSSSSNQVWFRGGYNDGYWRLSHSIEGLVIDGMGNTEANYVRADSLQYSTWRNWIIANMYRGGYSGNVDNNIFNSVYLNCRRSNENRYLYYRNGRYWYNRMIRIYDYDYSRSPTLFGSMNTHFQNYYNGWYGPYLYNGANWFQCEVCYRYYPVRAYKAEEKSISYTKFKNLPDDANSDPYYYESSRELYRHDPPASSLLVKDKDYILGNDFIFAGGVAKCFKEEEGAYRVYGGRSGGYADPEGTFQEIEIPPKSTVRITGEAKLPETTYNNGTSWSYCPHLLFYFINSRFHQQSAYGDNFYNSDFYSSNRKFSKFAMIPEQDVNFGSEGRFDYDNNTVSGEPRGSYRDTPFNSKTQYNSKTITIVNDSWFPRSLRVGFCSVNSNARFGWWEKPLKIAITKQGGLGDSRLNSLKKMGEYILKVGVSTVNNIKRIGGSRF
tara:strand:+ start:361 stop:3024 length:2664 start_codon:yes stop_codon:yes gene_type:complete